MKKVCIILLLLAFMSQQTYSQNSFNVIKYGSNPEKGKYVAIDTIQIYFETYGKGAPLLLLHGGLGSIANFEKCIPELAKHFHVIVPDTPGHGRSSQTDSLSYPLLSGYLSKFIDYLKLENLYIMGWSDGGTLGLMLSADRPDKVKKIIAVGVPTRFDALNEEGMQWVKNNMIDWAKNDKDWLSNYLSLTSQPEKIDSFLNNTKEMWISEVYIPKIKLESIKIPTMILQGDKDAIRIEHAIELHRIIDNSQLCILPNTTHFVFNEKPELMNKIAIDFFSSTEK